MRKLLGLPLALLVAGCTLAPDYLRPSAPVAPRWPEPGLAEGSRAASRIDWRSFFPDERLQALIATALEHNRDLRMAVARIDEARAQYGVSRADRLPTVNATGTRNIAGVSGAFLGYSDGSPHSTVRSVTSQRYDANVGIVSFELDFWNRIGSMTENARASYLATEEARRAARLSLIADVANAYFGVLEMDERVELARSTVDTREKTLALIEKARRGGFVSNIDILQAEGAVETARAELASMERQLATSINWLNMLIGHQPEKLPLGRRLLEQGVVDNLDAGVPSEVLVERPDVVAAEQRLIAANANIGAARAAFLPRILLTTSMGMASRALATLFGANAQAWSYQPTITMPIFDAGRTAGNVDVAIARKEVAVADYEKTLQAAFREVADLLATRSTLIDQRRASEAYLRTTEERVKINEARYRAGVASYLDVLDAQREMLGAQQAAVQVRRAQLGASAQLYKALGGG